MSFAAEDPFFLLIRIRALNYLCSSSTGRSVISVKTYFRFGTAEMNYLNEMFVIASEISV